VGGLIVNSQRSKFYVADPNYIKTHSAQNFNFYQNPVQLHTDIIRKHTTTISYTVASVSCGPRSWYVTPWYISGGPITLIRLDYQFLSKDTVSYKENWRAAAHSRKHKLNMTQHSRLLNS